MTKKSFHFGLNSWLVAILALLTFFWLGVLAVRSDGLTHIYFLDVGQGDSILITTSVGEVILIDGGPSAEVVAHLDAILPFWKRNLDLMVLTHPHADHVTGLVEVLQRYRVEQFIYNGSVYGTNIYATLLASLEAASVPVTIPQAGDYYNFSPCQLEVLYTNQLTTTVTDPNDTSLVTQLTCQKFDLLLTGDMSTTIENQLVEAGVLSDVEVLKVGHQGSHTSSGQRFLETVLPNLGVISVGKNNFGHPHADILARYEKLGIPIWRTDESGTVEIATDGEKYLVKAKKL